MARYSIPQIIALVLHYHPSVSDAQMLNGVAIEWAEAGGNSVAISPSSDYGLWQINRIHFGDGIITANNWPDPAVQVAEMWRLSSGMNNWAAWCTAWRDPGPNCGHGNLANVQAGSAAWAQVDQVSAAISRYRGTPPPGRAPAPVPPLLQAERAMSAEFADIRRYCTVIANQQRRRLETLATRIGRITG